MKMQKKNPIFQTVRVYIIQISYALKVRPILMYMHVVSAEYKYLIYHFYIIIRVPWLHLF